MPVTEWEESWYAEDKGKELTRLTWVVLLGMLLSGMFVTGLEVLLS